MLVLYKVWRDEVLLQVFQDVNKFKKFVVISFLHDKSNVIQFENYFM